MTPSPRVGDRRAFRWTRRKADIALRAERDQLREDLEWNVAEADRVAKALIEQVAYANRYRTTLVEIANGVHGMASVLAARALDPTEAPR